MLMKNDNQVETIFQLLFSSLFFENLFLKFRKTQFLKNSLADSGTVRHAKIELKIVDCV